MLSVIILPEQLFLCSDLRKSGSDNYHPDQMLSREVDSLREDSAQNAEPEQCSATLFREFSQKFLALLFGHLRGLADTGDNVSICAGIGFVRFVTTGRSRFAANVRKCCHIDLADIVHHLIGWEKDHIIAGLFFGDDPDVGGDADILIVTSSPVSAADIGPCEDQALSPVKGGGYIYGIGVISCGQKIAVIIDRDHRRRKKDSRAAFVQAALQV